MSGAVFPWRSGNRFELMIDGPSFFPRMLEAIAQAEQQVALELYLVEAGACAEAMVQALVGAAERGVRVRCLFDDYGSLAFTLGLRRRLIDAGVDLRFYNRLSWRRWMRNLYRDHRKLLLIDQTLAVVGGTGSGRRDPLWAPGGRGWGGWGCGEVTAGTKVALLDEANQLVKVVKARELAGQPDLLFRRNSETGAVECKTHKSAIELNAALHAHN